MGVTERRAVVLLSGGLDSATALAVSRADGYACYCLSVSYGQRHAVELSSASRVAASLGAREHRTVTVDLRSIGGSALTADMDVPKEGPGASAIPVTYVPARNMIMLAIAAGYAEVLGARHIVLGVNAVDYSGYPDCRPEFISAMERAATLGTKAGVEGAAFCFLIPLISLRKAEIIRLGTRLGVDYSLTTSCYDPGPEGLACGRCDSCRIRRRGFEEAGVPDPTRYLTEPAR